MSAPVFVDANVFVYARHAHETVKQPIATQWLEMLWRDQRGRTSIQAVNETYNVLTRKINPKVAADTAWDYTRTLLTWDPLPIDAALLVQAREIERRHHLSWWDSLIVGAAQLQNCAILLTEDLQDHAIYGGVTVRNPFTLGISEATAAYSVAPQVMSRHRGRGRPKRARMGPAI